MAEDGESHGIAKATELRRGSTKVLGEMRANAAGNALGGPGDPRPEIETALGTANTQLTQDRDRLGGVSREPVAQTPAGKRIFEDLVQEVGHELSQTTADVASPVIKTPSNSSSILSSLRSLLRR